MSPTPSTDRTIAEAHVRVVIVGSIAATVAAIVSVAAVDIPRDVLLVPVVAFGAPALIGLVVARRFLSLYERRAPHCRLRATARPLPDVTAEARRHLSTLGYQAGPPLVLTDDEIVFAGPIVLLTHPTESSCAIAGPLGVGFHSQLIDGRTFVTSSHDHMAHPDLVADVDKDASPLELARRHRQTAESLADNGFFLGPAPDPEVAYFADAARELEVLGSLTGWGRARWVQATQVQPTSSDELIRNAS